VTPRTGASFVVVDVSSCVVASTEGSRGDEELWLADTAQRRWLSKPRTELAWVPDVLLDHTHALTGSTVTVAAVNGSEVPAGIRLLVTLHGQVPTGYDAFDGPRWAPAA
jgi:hypothetical protein